MKQVGEVTSISKQKSQTSLTTGRENPDSAHANAIGLLPSELGYADRLEAYRNAISGPLVNSDQIETAILSVTSSIVKKPDGMRIPAWLLSLHGAAHLEWVSDMMLDGLRAWTPQQIGIGLIKTAEVLSVEAPSTFAIKQYVRDLSGYGSFALKQAMQQVIRTHRYNNYPKPVDFIEAANAVQPQLARVHVWTQRALAAPGPATRE